MIIFIFLQSNDINFLKSAVATTRTLISRNIFYDQSEPIQIVNIQPDKVVNNEPTTAAPPTLDLFNELDNFEQMLLTPEGDDGEVKLNYALKVALHVIGRYENENQPTSNPKGGRKKEKPATKIVIFTTLQNAELSEGSIGKLVEALQSNSISLFVATSNVTLALNENSTYDSITQAMEDPMLLPFELTELQQLIVQSKGLICNVDQAAALFEVYKLRKLPQIWNVTLQIGSKIQIPLQGYRKSLDSIYPKYQFTKRENQSEDGNSTKKIKTETEDILNNISLMDVHRNAAGSAYLTKEEKTAHKPATTRCLDVLFVLNENEVNQVHCVESPVRYMYPKDTVATPLYNAFRKSLIDENGVAIARYCYNKNVHPKLVALVPHGNVIQMFQIPYKDYITDPLTFIKTKNGLWSEPGDQLEGRKSKLDGKLKEDMDEFFKQMTIREEDNVLPVQFTYNPNIQFLQNNLVERARNPEFEMDIKSMSLKEFGFDRAEEALLNLIKNW